MEKLEVKVGGRVRPEGMEADRLGHVVQNCAGAVKAASQKGKAAKRRPESLS